MNITYLSFNPGTPPDGYWDMALLKDILSDPIFDKFNTPNGGLYIVPGAYNGDYVENLNELIAPLDWVILFITSDEESKFPVEKIQHKNIRIWVQYPKVGRHDRYHPLPLGYTSETRKNLELRDYKKADVFYSGQKTHDRRIKCSAAIQKLAADELVIWWEDTQGFSQGFLPDEYMGCMLNAKVAPAPSGAVSQDSFRLYEALEAGAIPIADDISPSGESGFWKRMFGYVPFPIIRDYDDLPGYITDQLESKYQEKANYVQAWWIREKRNLRNMILQDYRELTADNRDYAVTVIIPVSYIPSHPDVKILAETIESVRYHMPYSEIILTFDGLREEHKEHRADYDEFIRRALFYANTEWGPCYPMLFTKHTHQVGMARKALEHIKTELLLYVEQDTPLVTDEPIAWEELQYYILDGISNLIRFHFEAVIPEPHKHMMIGEPGGHLLKTVQWSQRPHLASTAFYRRILEQYFTPDAKCFIEDKLHGALYEAWKNDGMQGWLQWRVHIYFPNEVNIKRSLNLDGRAGGLKYDDTQIW